MELREINKPKVLVLGGVEKVRYKELAGNADVSYVPHVKKFRDSDITSFDAVVMLISQMSHAAAKKVKKVANRHNVPIHFLPSSGGTRFKCLLEDICGKNCLQKNSCFKQQAVGDKYTIN